MKHLFLFISIFLAASCGPPTSIGSASTNNKDVEVIVVADVEGCRIYRVFGSSRDFHFVKCKEVQPVEVHEQYDQCVRCGKNCMHCTTIDQDTQVVPEAPAIPTRDTRVVPHQ